MKPNRLTAAAVLLITVALAVSSCAAKTSEPHSAAITPTLWITGDVENELTMQDFGEYTVTEITYNEEAVPSIQLLSVLQDAQPVGADLSLFLSSPDGVMAQIPLFEIDEGCKLLFTSENGWVFNSNKHPKQSGIKMMDKIVVCAKEPVSEQRCFRVIYKEDYLTRTYGQLFNEDALVFSVLEGEAKMNESTTNAYTRRQLISLSVYAKELGAPEQNSALAYFDDGSQHEIDLKGYIEWRGDSADYIGSDKKSREPGIVGVWLDAPGSSVTDIASIALDKAEEGDVLIIELDGLGYYNLLELAPSFISGKNVYAMRTVMPSISNVALAAIVTGEMPVVNGVTERKQRDLLVADMFQTAEDDGLKCAVVEGSTALVSMSVEQTLNPDTDNNGDTDNEVQAAALKMLSEGYQFVYVHFHGYDDAAHTYGPSSNEAARKIEELDDYVKELCENFSGTVMITADHGQHATGDEDKPGNHGEFLPVDLTVPFILFEVNE